MRLFFNSITTEERPAAILLGLFLALIGVARLSLLGSGACSLGDEFRYWYTAQMLLAASHGDLSGALSPMFDTAGRPGLAIAQLPPVIAQSIVYKLTGLDPRCPDSLLIPQVWNVAVSLVGAWLFFRVGKEVVGFSATRSAWLTAAFSLMTGSTIYVRHLLPYDVALYLFLWVFLLVFKNNSRPILAGIFTAFAYSVYPGYWPLALVVSMLFIHKNVVDGEKVGKLIKPVSLFVLGFISLLISYEILAQISGRSFIENSLFGGQEFLHFLGLPYDGSFFFFGEYLLDVEGLPGMVLLASSLAYFMKLAINLARRRPLAPLDWLAIGLFAAFLFQRFVGLETGMKVFYGRLLRPISMASVWLTGAVLLPYLMLRKTLSVVLIGGFLAHFGQFFIEYRKLGYPRDVFFEFGFTQKADGLGYDIRSKTESSDGLRRFQEFYCKELFTMPPENPWHRRPKTGPDSCLVFFNFAAAPIVLASSGNSLTRYDGPDLSTIVSRKHYAWFAPYYFEEESRFSDYIWQMPFIAIARQKNCPAETPAGQPESENTDSTH